MERSKNGGMKGFPDPAHIGKEFGAWKATIVTISSTIAGVLAAFQIPQPWAYIAAAVLTCAGLGVTIWQYRRKSPPRDVEEANNVKRSDEVDSTAAGAAFRGLRRFRQGEHLPGTMRQRAAASLFAQVQRPSTHICIVTGDSGAGKSSLLECALVNQLERAGSLVVLVNNAARRVPPGCADSATEHSDITLVWQMITDDVIRSRGRSRKPVVLILDQFEELLSRFQVETARTTLGDHIQAALANGWRIVLGLRKEYYPELKTIGSRLAQPITLDDTFIVRNFEIAEAAEIIRECAQRDGLRCDADLPELIAADLALDSTVRPPDLQIVCEALRGQLLVHDYRRAGRAAGLRSRFIRDTIDLAGDAVLARTVLRELCDFPNGKKRADPISSANIAEIARLGAAGARASEEAVVAVLASLERAYVVVARRDNDTVRWSLIHDYLVEPIKLATEEQATRTEAAAAELDYFMAEFAGGRLKVIPLSKLRNIRRHAPPSALAQEAAQRLILRSMLFGYGKPSVVIGLVALASVLLVIIAATDLDVWRPVEAPLSHWDSKPILSSMLSAKPLTNDATLLAVYKIFPDPGDHVTLWNTQNGNRVALFEGPRFSIVKAKRSIWSYDSNARRLQAWTTSGQPEWSYDVPQVDGQNLDWRVSEVVGDLPAPTVMLTPAAFDEEVRGAVLKPHSNEWRVVHNSDYYPSGTSKREGSSEVSLSGVTAIVAGSAGKARLTVWQRDFGGVVFDRSYSHDVDLLSTFVFNGTTYITLYAAGRGLQTLRIKRPAARTGLSATHLVVDAETATPLPHELSWPGRNDNRRLFTFAVKGRLLIVEVQQTKSVIWPFDPVSAKFDEPIVSSAPIPFPKETLVWSSAGGTGIMAWHADYAAPVALTAIQIDPKDSLTFTRDHRRLVQLHADGHIELWDIDLAQRTANSLQKMASAAYTFAKFSHDEHIVIARQQGGAMFGWKLDGSSLGHLGTVGSDIIWSSYNEQCEQFLVWTNEGQRLNWRRGAVIPFYGLLPNRRCLASNRSAMNSSAMDLRPGSRSEPQHATPDGP